VRLNQSINGERREGGDTLFIEVTLFPPFFLERKRGKKDKKQKKNDNKMTNHQFIRSVQGAVQRENKLNLFILLLLFFIFPFLFFNGK
jgi:uncharacterized membrane protein YdjX (TVP38/TMEM64 family)